MAITAALVKDLRERTGSGMMECKKALVETDGDVDAAIDLMRKKGALKAGAKSSRIAAEGLVSIAKEGNKIAIVEVNSETDFVAKGDDFIGFVDALAALVMKHKPADLDALSSLKLADTDVETARKELIAKIGENINIRRFSSIDSSNVVSDYLHSNSRVGTIIEVEGGDEGLARDIAMHITASKPICISESEVPEEVKNKEKEIFVSQAAESGKPANIVEKMVQGKMNKFLKEITLLGQSFIKDTDKTIAQLLADSNATVKSFTRYEVGEGIEKKVENFAEEVKAQVAQTS